MLVVLGPPAVVVVGGDPAHDAPTVQTREPAQLGEDGVGGAGPALERVDEQVVQKQPVLAESGRANGR